jgi:TnpA family transposase
MMRHATTMQAEGNYVDSHGQSEIGLGLTRLLGYDLLPRIKQINKVRLYRPGREDEDSYERPMSDGCEWIMEFFVDKYMTGKESHVHD